MAMKSSSVVLFTAIALGLCTTQPEGISNSIPEDDEDSMTSAVFSLHFRATNSCDGDWYLPNIEPFTGAFAVSVANSINEACNNCGFTVGNLANVFPSCAGHSATFQAKIREWYSMDYPLNLLISVIQNRFNSSSVLTVPTSNFVAGSIDLPHLSFSPTNVSVHIDTGDEIGSGDAGGSGSTTDEEPIPTGDEISITTQDIGVIDSAGQTRPLFAVLVTAVAIVMGTVHFGLMH